MLFKNYKFVSLNLLYVNLYTLYYIRLPLFYKIRFWTRKLKKKII